MSLGPVSMLPADMLRPDVLVCFGEDPVHWAQALEAEGAKPDRRHQFRSVHAWCNDEGLTLLAPWGSAACEAVLWELTSQPGIERIALWGTAGALPGCHLPTNHPYAIEQAIAVHVAGIPEGAASTPTLTARGLTTARAISTDRFYGCSPTGAEARYGDPSGWSMVRNRDALIDMETAAFYTFMQRFSPRTGRIAIRALANPVTDLAVMPEHAPDALRVALRGALGCFD